MRHQLRAFVRTLCSALFHMRFLVLFFALPLCFALFLTACSTDALTSFQGYVEGDFAYIASPYGGRLAVLSVRRGERVERGTPLFQLDNAEESAALEQARQQKLAAEAQLADMERGKRPEEMDVLHSQLAQAQAVLTNAARQRKRDDAQYAAGAISQAQAEQTRTEHATASARVRELESQVAVGSLTARADQITAQRATLAAAASTFSLAEWRFAQKRPLAPAPAMVVDTLYREGEWVPPGSPVVKLLSPGQVTIRFFVPESALSRLAPGQPVRIHMDGRTEPLPAIISFIAPEAEYTPPIIYSNETRAKLIFLVEAEPAQSASLGLRPGQPVRVDWP